MAKRQQTFERAARKRKAAQRAKAAARRSSRSEADSQPARKTAGRAARPKKS